MIEKVGGTVSKGADPVTRMKAVKNAAEIAGARAAHARDGAALTRFLAWLDREAPNGRVSEIEAVKALETFRRETGKLKDVSFPTISGAGPNGAIVHYRVTEKSNRKLKSGELYLVDSGAQYEDGTTDVTRTVAIGEPSAEMRERFTLRAQGPYRHRHAASSPKARPARRSTASRARRSGPPASITTTAPATASAAISRCTRARRAFPSSAARRSPPAW